MFKDNNITRNKQEDNKNFLTFRRLAYVLETSVKLWFGARAMRAPVLKLFSMFKFGNTSRTRLGTCHDDLQLVFITVLQRSTIDFGIAEGHRHINRQQELYKQGKSQIDGINKKGKHNYSPSFATDIYAFINGKANWGEEYFLTLANLVKEVSKELFESGKITHKIKWGGAWNVSSLTDFEGTAVEAMEYYIETRKKQGRKPFLDLPHFELVTP